MPTYLYFCGNSDGTEVHGEFEEYHSINSKLEDCPKCIAEGKSGDAVCKVKRLICGTSKGVVELSGEDLMRQVKLDGKQFEKDVHAKESLYANVLGPDKYQQMQTQMDKRRRGR